MHSMSTRVNGARGYVALKVDMSKAYDKVEWNFLEAMMVKLGFGNKMVNLVQRGISTMRYSFNLNGSVVGSVTPERGLRKGCPLSPYLFLLCSEGLSRAISAGVQNRRFAGVRASISGHIVSHLFFADDSLFFMRANDNDVTQLLQIIMDYEAASGQLINLTKSAAFFSDNVPTASRQHISDLCGVEEMDCHEKYLGLPTSIGRNKKTTFDYLLERIAIKVKGWKEKYLSIAGKEILLKSVVQAVPSYAMSCFLLPKGICSNME